MLLGYGLQCKKKLARKKKNSCLENIFKVISLSDLIFFNLIIFLILFLLDDVEPRRFPEFEIAGRILLKPAQH